MGNQLSPLNRGCWGKSKTLNEPLSCDASFGVYKKNKQVVRWKSCDAPM